MKRVAVGLIVLAGLCAGGWYGWRQYAASSRPTAASYRLGAVSKQDVVVSITATGTLVPEDVVDVGTQVNGLIDAFGVGADGKQIDYRSTVKADQMLAQIDDALYAAQVSADEASLAQAKSAVKVAEATRDQARARMDQMERDWARAQKLGESQALSQADYDAAKSNFEQAGAAIAVADAQIAQANSQVAIAEAALQRSRRNLSYCTIKSPVDGVIIDRRVEIGQTVVSSLNAPSLFLIAKDLSRMLVLVQVNEADIGHVSPGDKVTFGADAFPSERFHGEVRKVRLNATMTQNVVTYTVEIITSNADLKLLPYLTANVKFVTARSSQVLTVPNGALRWAPAGADDPSPTSPTSPAAQTQNRGENRAATKEGGERRAEGRAPRKPTSRVWVLRDGVPSPVAVTPGLSDGTVTEITSDELRESDEVIIGQASASAAASGTTNPFAPSFGRGRGGR